MKKLPLIVLGIIIFLALGIQTYQFYRLQQKVDQLSASNTIDFNQFPTAPLDDQFMTDDSWDPYQEMQWMEHEMSRVFGNSLSRFHLNSKDSLTKMPAFNLKEETDRYIATVDIPGGNPSSLDVKLNEQELSISIKTEHLNDQTKGNKNQYHRQERFFGTYQRSITLPGPVKESAMTSEYKNGVLTIVIPKA